MWRKMLVGKPMIYGEFFLYAKSFVVRLLFERHDDEYNITNISVSEYVEEYISQYMSVHFYVNPWKNNEDAYGLKQEVRCLECVHEKYIYSEGKLTEGEYLRYHFPRVDYTKSENDRYGFKGVLICNLYEFKYDDESRIEGFYGGDLTNRLLNMDCFYKLDKSKKESTRKESGRWKRPNYYIEM